MKIKNAKFKSLITYTWVLFGFAIGFKGLQADVYNSNAATLNTNNQNVKEWKPVNIQNAVNAEQDVYDYNIDSTVTCAANELCDVYMDKMLTARKVLAPHIGKEDYKSFVRQEIPGAPAGMHCVYSQTFHLRAAEKDQGTQLNIVPPAGRSGCSGFVSSMRKAYSRYNNCIFEGKVYKSDAEYNDALNTYLKTKGGKGGLSQEDTKKYTDEFAKQNISADNIQPGSMLIVERGGAKYGHMIMYVGRGRVQDGNFVPDTAGIPIYAGHNTETIGSLCDVYDMSNVFVSNTREIARVKYKEEVNNLGQMTKEQLLDYLAQGKSKIQEKLQDAPITKLYKMARFKYFHNDKFAKLIEQDNLQTTKQQDSKAMVMAAVANRAINSRR